MLGTIASWSQGWASALLPTAVTASITVEDRSVTAREGSTLSGGDDGSGTGRYTSLTYNVLPAPRRAAGISKLGAPATHNRFVPYY